MANLNLHGDISTNEELLAKAHGDLITFGKLFSPQDFLASATPNFHVEVGKLLLDEKIQQLGLVLPRDHAKSTLASTAILHPLCLFDLNGIILVLLHHVFDLFGLYHYVSLLRFFQEALQ